MYPKRLSIILSGAGVYLYMLYCKGLFSSNIVYHIATCCALHTGYVFSTRRSEKGSMHHSFSPGDADDMIMDGLRSGDIVLFKRSPLLHYLPTAVYISSFQALHGTEYDHSGVVIIEPNGAPMILETTFGQSVQYRPYAQRILHSKAEQIVLIPVRNRQEETSIEREHHAKVVSSLTREYAERNTSFLVEAYRGLLSAGMEKLFGEQRTEISFSPAAYLTAQAIMHLQAHCTPRDLHLGPAEYLMLQIVKKKMEIQRAKCDVDK